MKTRVILYSLVVIVVYVGVVTLIGFEGYVSQVLHFIRLAVTMGVLVLYIPAIRHIFAEIPPPRRDYLVAGIMLTWLSGVGFSILNTLGQVHGVERSIFISPVAGFFSLLLLMGGVFHIVAPQTTDDITRREALMIGAIFAALLVIIVPYLGGSP